MFNKAKSIKATTQPDGTIKIIIEPGADGISPDKDEVVKDVLAQLPDFKVLLKEIADGLPRPKDGISPNKAEIIDEVLARIPPVKDGVSPDKQEIIDEVKRYFPSYSDLLKEIERLTPQADDIVPLVLSKIPPVKDGVSPDKQEIIKEIESRLPSAKSIATEAIKALPSVDDIVSKVLIKMPPPKDGISPSKEEIIRGVLTNISIPKDGKDSPLSELFKVESSIKRILGADTQTLLQKEFEDGFHEIVVTVSGKTADLSGAAAWSTRLFLLCTNGKLSKLQETPVYTPVITNSKLKMATILNENKLEVTGTGIEGIETVWKTSFFLHG